MRNRADFENDPLIINAIQRGLIEIHGDRIIYNIHQKKSYNWSDPEEWVRARTVAFLVLEKSYTPRSIRTEVIVPRRTPEDLADVVVYKDERCQEPYLVVENKKENLSQKDRNQAIEQLFGNTNSLRAPVALFDSFGESVFFDVANYLPTERIENIKGTRDVVPVQYGQIPEYTFIAGPGNNDVRAASAYQLESKVKRAHSIIWAGGKRDPLLAFDEWSKLMLAKVEDERHTPNNTPRQFQVGTNETYVAVATRVHELFKQACLADPTIFPELITINLSDKKIVEVVKVLQDICITDTSVDKSCLDTEFTKERLKLGKENFNVVVGNPPFGDTIKEGDEDQLGKSSLEDFEVSAGRSQIPSEHIIVEKSIKMLKDDGLLGLVLPDGVFNNQGELSNCPLLRNYLVKQGRVLAVVSLPDYAFRKSGAQNKTSILFFKKFNYDQRTAFENAYDAQIANGASDEQAIIAALSANPYRVFMAEANFIGYSSTGALMEKNDLYRGSAGGHLDDDQSETILGEYRRFCVDPENYIPALNDCIGLDICSVWNAHESHRLDPKYHLFKVQEEQTLPEGWVSKKLSELMQRREEIVRPQETPEAPVVVMTLSQTGDIRPREAGKGKNPPEWLGMYFEDSPSTWYKAHQGDLVYSSIDLWKGCIAVVPEQFNGALVTKEFPIYRMLTDEIDPEFLAILLRSRYYQRAFRAITTGHSNRRRTQTSDFESIEVCYPPDKEIQRALIVDVLSAKARQRSAVDSLNEAMLKFSDIIDGRGDEAFGVDLDENFEEE